MNKKILSVLILISGILISGGIISLADAQTTTPGDIQYPIPELGNCKSESNCKVFCDAPKNSDACLAFAEQLNLMTPEELANAKKFKDNGMIGPGSCRGQAECDKYCNNSSHMEECMTFAQKNGMMSQDQLEESEKVLAAIKRGIKPPACNGPEECDAYCGASEHMEECINFSIETGMMPKQEQEQAQKMLSAIKQGIKPPACKPTPPPNQLEQAQSNQINKPNRPEQEGLQACDAYCADPSHIEECVKFSVAMGNMTEQQAQMSIKNDGKGPGGCIGKDACNTFCDNPDNQETCFEFGKENGMIPEGDLQKMQEGQQKMKDSFSKIPQEVLDCITTSSGAEVVEKMKTGSVIGRKFGDSINQCFQQFGVVERRPDQNQNQNQNDQNQQNQPGDKFQPEPGNINPGGQQMPQQAGPGGCKGPEECQKYCALNPEVCKNFQSPQNQQGQPNQPGQIQPRQPQEQFNQPGQLGPDQPDQIQPGQPNQFNQPNPLNQLNQINQPGQQPGQFIQGQPGQMEPQQQLQPQFEPQPLIQQQDPLPPSSPTVSCKGRKIF